jgi:hypothetical protein
MKWTPCECSAAGWCERHQCQKPQVFVEKCQTSREMFDRWEQGLGPCTPVTDIPVSEQGPSMAQRAANFGSAVIRYAANGLKQVDQATFDARIAICRQCPSCDTERMICRQPSCGCSLSIKAWWASESCPIQLWPSRSVSESVSEQRESTPATQIQPTSADDEDRHSLTF